MRGERGRSLQGGGTGKNHPDPADRHESRGVGSVGPAADLPFQVLESRLAPPRPLLALVPRASLLDVLQTSVGPLVLLAAPAGAGKTSAMLEWGEADRRPFTWLKVDQADNDPAVFLIYLVAALGRVSVIDPQVDQLLQLAVPPVVERILPLLARALAAAPPFVLVVDDASLLVHERCWWLLSFVLDNLPPGAQLAIGARSEPLLPLGRLRAEGRLVEVGTPQLAFDRAEAAQLWRAQGVAADDEALDAVLAATEGWAAGLYLASLIGRQRPSEEWLGQVHGARREIGSYLTTEVLRQVPDDVQQFLCHTSILDEMTVAACRELTGRDDAGDVLLGLARQNLFVSPLDGSLTTFRYHRLFAELLRAELVRREPAEVEALHATAARYYLGLGDLDRAFRHELAAGAIGEAAKILTHNWPRLWDMGQSETVRRWLASFTDGQILDDPALILTAGWVYSALADSAASERWTVTACTAKVDERPAPFGAASLRSAQALLCATVAPDGVAQMRECAETAASLEAAPGSSWYVDARVALGTARWLSGASRQAVRPLQIAAREGVAFNPSAELAALGTLSLIAADEDDWTAAHDYAERAATRLADLGLGSYRRSLFVLLAQTRVSVHEGIIDVGDLIARIEEILDSMVPHPWMSVVACVVLGEVSLEAGDRAAALHWSARAAAELKRYPDAGAFRGRADRLRKTLELGRLAEPLTNAEHALLEVLPTHLTEAQIAERLFVSPNTVKSHLHAIYRKLGVNSRAQAVECARELGLLKAG